MSNSWAGELTIQVENNRTPGANFYLVIHEGVTDGSWDDEPVAHHKETLPADTNFLIKLDLPDGQYAARAYVDSNDNGELDTASFGRPREPFAISIGEKRRKPSVRFNESVFLLDETHTQVKLTLRYPKATSDAGRNE